MQSRNIFNRTSYGGNQSLSNPFSNDSQPKLGTNRVSKFNGQFENSPNREIQAAINPRWGFRDMAPYSIGARAQTMHLSLVELRIEDYYRMRKGNLSEDEQRLLLLTANQGHINQKLIKTQISQQLPQPFTAKQQQIPLSVLTQVNKNRTLYNSQYNPYTYDRARQIFTASMLKPSTTTNHSGNIFGNNKPSEQQHNIEQRRSNIFGSSNTFNNNQNKDNKVNLYSSPGVGSGVGDNISFRGLHAFDRQYQKRQNNQIWKEYENNEKKSMFERNTQNAFRNNIYDKTSKNNNSLNNYSAGGQNQAINVFSNNTGIGNSNKPLNNPPTNNSNLSTLKNIFNNNMHQQVHQKSQKFSPANQPIINAANNIFHNDNKNVLNIFNRNKNQQKEIKSIISQSSTNKNYQHQGNQKNIQHHHSNSTNQTKGFNLFNGLNQFIQQRQKQKATKNNLPQINSTSSSHPLTTHHQFLNNHHNQSLVQSGTGKQSHNNINHHKEKLINFEFRLIFSDQSQGTLYCFQKFMLYSNIHELCSQDNQRLNFIQKIFREHFKQYIPKYHIKQVSKIYVHQREGQQHVKCECNIILTKINLPEGYSFRPYKFKDCIVQNLEIFNEFGSLKWPGETNIEGIDFSQGIQISKKQVQIKIKQLNKLCYATFFSIPDQFTKFKQMNEEVVKETLNEFILSRSKGLISLQQLSFERDEYKLRIEEFEINN